MFARAPSAALGRGRGRLNLVSLPLLCGREPPRWGHEEEGEARGDELEGRAPIHTYNRRGPTVAPSPTIASNYDSILHAGTCPIRAVAEAPWGSGDAHVQSTATRRPRPQAVGAHGASLLPFRLPARPSPGAPWARGLPSAFWERGSPDLPACGLRCGSRGSPAWPIFISTSSRPSRGAKPSGADDRRLPQARPRQAGSRGGGEIKVGYLTRCP